MPDLASSIDESARLAVLRSYAVLDTPPEKAFEELVEAAARICGAPISAVSLVDSDRQWFKAQVGLEVTETPRDVSFCDHAMGRDDLLIVPDALADPTFADNPLVTGDLGIRFYAGAPIRSAEGAPLGALCIIDRTPRPGGLTEEQSMVLRVLANQVQTQLDLRRLVLEQQEGAKRVRDADVGRALALDAAGLGAFDHKPHIGERFYDPRALTLMGVTTPESRDRELVLAHVHPEDRGALARALDEAVDPKRAGLYRHTFRVIHDGGDERWISSVGRTQFVDGACVRFMGVLEDVTDAKKADEHRRLLSNELNHRVKNTLAVMQSLMDSTLRSSTDTKDARGKINARIQAFGKAHDLLTASNWSAALVQSVVEGVVTTLSLPRDRVEVEGPPILLGPQPALQLALALHELSTNALKYGALSNDVGRVALQWRVEPGPQGERFEFAWTERGGPPVALPTRKGFGTQLIERATAGAFGGQVALNYEPTGVRWRLSAPRSGLAESGRAPLSEV